MSGIAPFLPPPLNQLRPTGGRGAGGSRKGTPLRRGPIPWSLVASIGLLLPFPGRAGSEPRYNRDVLPILADQCFACHGFDRSHRKAGLRLDTPEGAIAELESGRKAVIAGDPQGSALFQRIVSHDPEETMPPPTSGRTLTTEEKEVLRRWIAEGAEYEPHWSYLPPVSAIAGGGLDPASTSPRDGSRIVDCFIRERLEREGIPPSPAADRTTLIRRVTLDLTGLPPAPEEIAAFLESGETDAYARLVDRLLASPAFGERWARWWLDLAHYADSDGYLQDFIRPVAWRYRQWVVDAFNGDLPFDRFTIEQLAGDLLPDATESQRMATGFLRNTLSNREGGADLEEFRVKQVIDRTNTLGTVWLGLTVACAQCHDHKFDAISQREFFQLYAFFDGADEVNFNAPLPGEREPYEAARRGHDRKRAALLAPVAKELAELQSDWELRLLHAEAHPNEDFAWDRALELLGLQWGQSLGEGQLEGLNIIKLPPDRRSADQRDRLLDYFLKASPAPYAASFQKLGLGELKKQLDALAAELPSVTRAPGMTSYPRPRVTRIHVRGEFRRPGEEVAPGTPSILPPLTQGSDRLALARWLVSPEHPLTARVAVNRLWQELFGRGLVATSENFGVRGDRPSHPELLDWLALEFVREGWSVKAMLRTLVLSETYRQSSVTRPDLSERDPVNALLARQARLRLSGEAIRDAALAAGGLLDRTLGGPSVKPPQPESVSKDGYRNSWEPSPGRDRYRRGLYTFLQRTSPYAQFVTFDLPDTSMSCSRRERSNTPLQALTLLNDPVFLEAARALAVRVASEVGGDDQAKLERAFLRSLGRPPSAGETARLLGYLGQQRDLFAAEAGPAADLLEEAPPGTDPAWIALASVLLNLDEFIHRE